MRGDDGRFQSLDGITAESQSFGELILYTVVKSSSVGMAATEMFFILLLSGYFRFVDTIVCPVTVHSVLF